MCSVLSRLKQTVPLKARGGICHLSGLLDVLQVFTASLVMAEKVGILPVPCVKRFYLGRSLSDLICFTATMESKGGNDIMICLIAAMTMK